MDLINKNLKSLNEICKLHNVDTLYLFGSALNGNFNKKSDIDFLVKFGLGDLENYFENYFHLKESLSELLGYGVDLLEEQTLSNPILKESINKNKALIYG